MLRHQPLTRTHNNITVFIDARNSHSATHFNNSPKLKALATTVIQTIDATRPNIQIDYDFGSVVGFCDLTVTSDSDDIVYAKRLGRTIYSRFVKNKEMEPTTFVTVVLQRIPAGYLLLSAWLGPSVPPFPGDRREWPESRYFWKTHALIFGNQAIDERTLTSSCPW